MNIWVESLPGKEHQIEQILTQIIKEMFIGMRAVKSAKIEAMQSANALS